MILNGGGEIQIVRLVVDRRGIKRIADERQIKLEGNGRKRRGMLEALEGDCFYRANRCGRGIGRWSDERPLSSSD